MQLRHLVPVCLISFSLQSEEVQLDGIARTRELAAQGNKQALLKIADGHAAQIRYKSAFDIYLPLAEAGDTRCQQIVGSWLLHGRKHVPKDQQIPQDVKAGLGWLNQAAHKGDQKAMVELGRCYREGWGVQKDAAEAYKWFTLGRSTTDKLTDSIAAVSDREQLAQRISTEDAREGQRRADAFRALKPGETSPIRPDFLKLELISGTSQEPVAMINGHRFTPGQSATLIRLGQPVLVQCVEITRDQAFVVFPPNTNRFALSP